MRRRQALVLTWTACAVVSTAALAASEASYSALDDPNIAYERPGILDLNGAPPRAPAVAPGIPVHGHRSVVFLSRQQRVDVLATAVGDDAALRAAADLVIVVEGTAGRQPASPLVVFDRGRRLASEMGVRVPRDGGYPVGYALIDSAGRVRYATLDPDVSEHLTEVATMLAATP